MENIGIIKIFCFGSKRCMVIMLQVSRDSNLKIPKELEIFEENPNSIEDMIAVKKAIANADDKKFNAQKN